MVPAATVQSASSAQPGQAGPVRARHGFSFHELLSELNPLQYLPVVGTIYRAVTGDTIPETARLVGSLVVSGLTGGPVGVAMNVGMTALERVAGFDPERLGQRVLASLGVGHATQAPVAAAAASVPRAWSAAQLTAYGVTRADDGEMQLGTLLGAEALNAIELRRLHLVA